MMPSILRRQCTSVKVGDKVIGGNNPVLVQSMTNTSTEDVLGTTEQIHELWSAGSEIVRITVNTREAARSVSKIVSNLERKGISVPLVGDFHFNGHLLLQHHPDCARLLAKYRINPGNVGRGAKHDENFQQMIAVALRYDKPLRIGVNWGSVDPDLISRLMDENSRQSQPSSTQEVLIKALINSALTSADMAEAYGLPHDHIVLSAKVSEVPALVEIYRSLAKACDYPLHLGLTEAGLSTKGIIASTAGLSILLGEGIGDTIRVSLTPEPGGDRKQEVLVCQQILQSLNLRSFAPQVTACPGCGRTTSSVFQAMAKQIQDYLDGKKLSWQTQFPGSEELKVAVMGCIVNGPGESKHANVGISLPGTGEEPRAPVYVDGIHITTLSGPHLVRDFIEIINRYVEERYSTITNTQHQAIYN